MSSGEAKGDLKFPVKTLVGTGIETSTWLLLACDSPAPCSMVKTCVASLGEFVSDAGGSSPDYDTTYKINIFKQS